MNCRKLSLRILALALASVTLTGCSGGDKKEETTPTPTAAVTPEPTAAATDWSKYNTYIDLTDDIYEMEEVLNAYFENVDYAADFALLEGGSYDAIKEAAQFYTPVTITAKQAIKYADEEPSYPEADAAMKAMGDALVGVMDTLGDIAAYVRFSDYADDNLAKAPELHAELWEALSVYDQYIGSFMTALAELSESTKNADLAQLLEDGQLIMYHSSKLINESQDLLDVLWDQIEEALMAAGSEGELVLPQLDLTDAEEIYTQFAADYSALAEALENPDEVKKVDTFNGTNGDGFLGMFKNEVASFGMRMVEMMEAVRAGTDYADAYDAASQAGSDMVDAYNKYLV